MYPVTKMEFNEFGYLYKVFYGSPERNYIITYEIARDLEVLQYLFNDVNGNEVYEGDILQNPWGERFEMRTRYIELPEEGSGTDWKERARDLYGFFKGIRTEVIGNIFENPELIAFLISPGYVFSVIR